MIFLIFKKKKIQKPRVPFIKNKRNYTVSTPPNQICIVSMTHQLATSAILHSHIDQGLKSNNLI